MPDLQRSEVSSTCIHAVPACPACQAYPAYLLKSLHTYLHAHRWTWIENTPVSVHGPHLVSRVLCCHPRASGCEDRSWPWRPICCPGKSNAVKIGRNMMKLDLSALIWALFAWFPSPWTVSPQRFWQVMLGKSQPKWWPHFLWSPFMGCSN